jgi:hypothetical protein
MWSEIELELGALMVAFLGASAIPTVAIYTDLLAFRTREQALRSAAQKTLSPDHLDIFEAVISIVKSVAKQRDRLAHWLWRISDDLPDAILLIDPRILLPAFADTMIKALGGTFAEQPVTHNAIGIDSSDIFV